MIRIGEFCKPLFEYMCTTTPRLPEATFTDSYCGPLLAMYFHGLSDSL